MYNESRMDIYDYLYNLVYDVVTKNVYRLGEPTETTTDDTENGFVVIAVGNLTDDSEFYLDTYGQVRCTFTAFVPKKSRGRLDADKYRAFESSINDVVKNAIENANDGDYSILADGILSMDDNETSQKGNQYHVYVKSFIVVVDANNVQPTTKRKSKKK